MAKVAKLKATDTGTTATASARKLIDPRAARAISGGFSVSTLRRLVARGEFPRPVVLSRDGRGKPARIAYVEDEVLRWCEDRIAARDLTAGTTPHIPEVA